MSQARQNPGPEATVSLREVTAETVRTICNLKVAPEQEQFVASNAFSIAQAYFEPKAWFRAIYADETPVGFIMLWDDAEAAAYFLWRLMIAADYQGQGFGRQALLRLIDYVRTRPGATELVTSYHPGEGSPRDFYRKLGFAETGAIADDGEVLLQLSLTPEKDR
jgi:diamine N-acetyltransferase